MANSYEITVASGASAIVSVPFPYLQKAHVHVYLDGVEVDQDTLTWPSSNTIELPSTPAAGTATKVRRITPSAGMEVVWSNPSSLSSENLNKANLQLLYVAQEAYDIADLTSGGIENVVEYLDQMAAYYNLVTLLAAQADQAKELAEQWATESVNTPVVPGKYSAYHWAQIAQAIVGVIALGVPFTPAAGISSTNVQAALEELAGDVTALSAGNKRELLSGNRTYYVRTNGSDSNNGLANTSGGAFLTIQKAIDVVTKTLDLGGNSVTIQLADGTYTAGAVLDTPVIGGKLYIKGNGAANDNVKVQVSSGPCFKVKGGGSVLYVWDLRMRSLGSGADADGLLAADGGTIYHQNTRFDTCNWAHMAAEGAGSLVEASSAYSMAGGSGSHYSATRGGRIKGPVGTCYGANGSSYSYAFAYAAEAGLIEAEDVSFAGTITGSRWWIEAGGVIKVGGRGVNVFPGNIAGDIADYGRYS